MSENLKNGDFALILHLKGSLIFLRDLLKLLNLLYDEVFFHLVKINYFTILVVFLRNLLIYAIMIVFVWIFDQGL